MAKKWQTGANFGWQGVRLQVPENWNLGRMDGNEKSGYARLDDSEIVRAEVEWRQLRDGQNKAVAPLIDRYVETLEKKAKKAGTPFTVERRARFLKDKRWLEGYDYETFIWEADYRAYNLARLCSRCGRVVLLRVLGHLDEDLSELAEMVFSTLEDHPREGEGVFWSVYGLSFFMPEEYKLTSQELKSGHIQLNFEHDKHTCRIQRLSLAKMLLKGTTLARWYPRFFTKQLKDFKYDVNTEDVEGHQGLRIDGRPRSRWRQLLRPLPLVNPRPRLFMHGRVWYCADSDKICIVDHLYRKERDRGDLTQVVSHGYLCHQKQAEADARGDVELAADAQ